MDELERAREKGRNGKDRPLAGKARCWALAPGTVAPDDGLEMANANRWFRRLLSICPVLIAVFWVAGVGRFRGYTLTPYEWVVVLAAAFALHTLTSIAERRRPLPPLPEGGNPVTLSLLAALILGVIAAIVATVFEAVVDEYRPSQVALPWRATWHAACAAGATYCGFLYRLLGGPRKPDPGKPGGP